MIHYIRLQLRCLICEMIKWFTYATCIELGLILTDGLYALLTKNLELGALIIGFILIVLAVYYSLYIVIIQTCTISNKKLRFVILLFFNLLPFLAYCLLFVFG